jgi:excisionase family DNA binding protein
MTLDATNGKMTAPPRNFSNPRRRAEGPRAPLLGVDEVAGWLGVEVVYVRRLVSERRIPFVKLGKYVRFDPDEVAGWVDGLRVQPTSRSAARNHRRNR